MVLAKVDAWVAGVRKRGFTVELVTNNRPIVIVGRPTQWETVRTLRFGNGAEFSLQIYAASVEGGAVSHNLKIIAPFTSRRTGSMDLWNLSSIESTPGIYLHSPRPARVVFPEYACRSNNPSADVDLIKAINSSLDTTMAFVMSEGIGDALPASEPAKRP